MKYNIIRVKAGSDELEGETIATGLTTPEFEDTDVEPGKRYEYIVEAYTDGGQYQDRNVVFTKAKGGDLFPDGPDYDVEPLDCDAYEFTDNYTAFSTLVPVEKLHDEMISSWGYTLIPGAELDTEFTLIATEEVETRPIVGDQAGVEKINVYVYEADFEWENEITRVDDDVPVQLKWLHDVFQFKNGAPKSMVGVFCGVFTELKCGMQLIRDAVDNGLIKSPDLNHAFAGNRFEDGVPDFVGDAAPVKLRGTFAGCTKLNQELTIDSSNVAEFDFMFYGALRFNSPISLDASSGTKFDRMFYGAAQFNQPLDFTFAQDDISLNSMFSDAIKFNQDIGGWNVENVTGFNWFLSNALSFDQDLSGWTTSENVLCDENECQPDGFANNSPIADSPEKLPQWNCCDDELPTTTILVSNKELTWDNLPTVESDNGSLVETDNGDGTFTYEADFEWNNRSSKLLIWLVDVLQFKDNKLGDGNRAFYRMPAAQLTALPDLDTSNLTNMRQMFEGAQFFNQPLDNFDTSNVENMYSMFKGASSFNQSLDHFKTSKVESMDCMFEKATVFNHPVPFDTSSVTGMKSMFSDAVEFNQSLETWDTSLVRTMAEMFQNANSFDHPVEFNTSNVTNIKYMFNNATVFNQPVPFNTSKVDDMSSMFKGAQAFDQPVEFDTSKVTIMNNMFEQAKVFNHPVEFDTSNVTAFSSMFRYAEKFNQPVNFDTSNAFNMEGVFTHSYEFNQSLETWDTSKVSRMKYMFMNATVFNQPLDHFNTSGVKDMREMFADAKAFDQDISNWCVSQVEGYTGPGTKPYRFDSSAGFVGQDDKQPCWGYCGCDQVPPATTILVSNKELTWADLPAANQIPNRSLELLSDNGDGTYTYEADFKWDNGNGTKLTWLVDVLKFKDNKLQSGKSAFREMPAAQLTALPDLDTSNLTDMTSMFKGASSFNQPLDNFNTSKVTKMAGMFGDATAFNQPLNFDTGKVTDMSGMFGDASAFNKPLNWNTSNVTNMRSMFDTAPKFNQALNWDTSKVTDMSYMFFYASALNQPLNFNTSNVSNMAKMFGWAGVFNQNLSGWCVSKIATKPDYFDKSSGFEGQTAKQPKWGQAC